MDKEKLIAEAKRIQALGNIIILETEAKEFIRRFAGIETDFYKKLNEPIYELSEFNTRAKGVMGSFIQFMERGLLSNSSFEREIKIETVSDFLDQANTLLRDKSVHPAAPAVLIGAALEEFLRTWLEEGVEISEIKNSIDSYVQELRKRGLINKQDIKDITSWAGSRNDAAHGHFEEVNDRKRIGLMLEGVNNFIRKYTPE